MFFSKIWFFLIAVAAAVAVTISLVLPRPAERSMVNEEQQRLVVACGVIDILLTDDARNRIELAGSFARTREIVNALESASGSPTIDEARMKQVRAVGDAVMKEVQGNRKPDFAMLIDRKGRVIARVKLDDSDFGDVAAGRPLIDDALAGYLRDDLWAQNNTIYFVSAAPVIKRDPPVSYVGAVVLGYQVTNALAKELVSSINVDVGFHLGKDEVAGSKTLAIDHTQLLTAVGKLTGGDRKLDCQANIPLQLTAGNEGYTAIVARLPGEAAGRQAFYSVFIKRPHVPGFAGTLRTVSQGDLAFAKFPWVPVAGGFLFVLLIGIGLMFFEADRPLRRLTADAVRLAKGESERLSEDGHGGKFGSIARSVNIHIDKLGREAKTAKQDLDGLLGPAPEGSLGTIDLLATALPSVRPGGPVAAISLPPSDFKFLDSGSPSAVPPGRAGPAGPTQPRAGTPPPFRAATPPAGVAPPTAARVPTPPPGSPTLPAPSSLAPPPLALEDDILGEAEPEPEPEPEPGPDPSVDPHFKEVFDQFVSTKRSCGEPISGLTYAKFVEKLVKNRADLIAKTGSREVRFTVYVKDGKAALKATPVKEA